MKLLVDMPLSPALAQWLRTEGFDALHASEAQMHVSPDVEILSVAIEQERVIVTADLDFPRLLARIGTSGPGLILLRGGNYTESESLDCVRRVLKAIAHDELPKSIVVVDREKIRRRWLPILVTLAA